MTREEMEAKVRESYEVWNRHDAAGVAAYLHPDCVFHDNSRELRGRDQAQAAAQAYFDAFSDVHTSWCRCTWTATPSFRNGAAPVLTTAS